MKVTFVRHSKIYSLLGETIHNIPSVLIGLVLNYMSEPKGVLHVIPTHESLSRETRGFTFKIVELGNDHWLQSFERGDSTYLVVRKNMDFITSAVIPDEWAGGIGQETTLGRCVNRVTTYFLSNRIHIHAQTITPWALF